MARITKRMKIISEKIDSSKCYNVDEAISLLKEVATSKFIESVDIAVNLGIDARKSNQNIRGTVLLPHGTGRSVNIAVFAQGANAEAAKLAGAEFVGMEDLAELIKEEKLNFNVVIASPDTMHVVSKLGKILGPKGLMPNPKLGTVTNNITESVKNIKSGQICYRNDKNGIVHTTIGKINFSNDKLKENLESFLDSLKKFKPIQFKGTYIKKVSISTTMGVGIIVNWNNLNTNIN